MLKIGVPGPWVMRKGVCLKKYICEDSKSEDPDKKLKEFVVEEAGAKKMEK